MFKQTLKTSKSTPDFTILNQEELVFVYGTLMAGYINNRCFSEGRAALEGYGTTFDRFRAVNLGTYPGIHKYDPDKDILTHPPMIKRIKEEFEFRPIIGEIYRVKRDTMLTIDLLEGNNDLFYREKIKLQLRTPTGNRPTKDVEAWCYILKYPHKYEVLPILQGQPKQYYSWRACTRAAAA